MRTIPMQESVYKALKRQRIQVKELQMMCEEWTPLEGFENLVFLGMNGKPISERAFQVTLDGIEKAINKERECIAKKNKTSFEPIPHFYPHALRHTFATRCFEAGIEAKVVQTFLWTLFDCDHIGFVIRTSQTTKQNQKWKSCKTCMKI